MRGWLAAGKPRHIIVNGFQSPNIYSYYVYNKPVNHSVEFAGATVTYPVVKERFSGLPDSDRQRSNVRHDCGNGAVRFKPGRQRGRRRGY